MIYSRRACITCGTRFTPSNEQEVECGECYIWARDFDEWGPVPATHRLRDRSKNDHAPARSMANYRAVARKKPPT